jgi:hypothetical protein
VLLCGSSSNKNALTEKRALARRKPRPLKGSVISSPEAIETRFAGEIKALLALAERKVGRVYC